MNIEKINFSSEKEVSQFVDLCEQKYLDDVKIACEKAMEAGKIITLCGPTCSGKTTTALILDDEFKALGKELHTISIDDFYFDRSVLEERSKNSGEPLDYDSPATIDIELFARVVEDIENGGLVKLPVFEFKSGSRIGFKEINVTEGDVFLFEGIQAVYPELVKYLLGHDYTSLFISVEDSFDAFGEHFDNTTLRFLRRLVRDARTRGATAEFTFSIWQSVVSNEVENIYPNLSGVDFRINSHLGYEVSVIKPFALPLLYSIEEDSAYFEAARALIKKLDAIPTIDAKYVPSSSVFREFIGNE